VTGPCGLPVRLTFNRINMNPREVASELVNVHRGRISMVTEKPWTLTESTSISPDRATPGRGMDSARSTCMTLYLRVCCGTRTDSRSLAVTRRATAVGYNPAYPVIGSRSYSAAKKRSDKRLFLRFLYTLSSFAALEYTAAACEEF
jgi:hypothetical protein